MASNHLSMIIVLYPLSADNVASVAADVGRVTASSVVATSVTLGGLGLSLRLGLVVGRCLVVGGLGSSSRGRAGRSTALNSLGNITRSTVSATADGTAGDDIGAGSDIVGGRGAPKGEVDGRVVLLVDTGDLDRGTGDAGGAVTGHLHLGTSVVELSLATVSSMKSNVLTTDEVLAVGESRGDLEVDRVLTPAAPSSRAEGLGVASLADLGLVDLVPVEVGGRSSSSVVDSSGVNLDRTRVLHSSATEGLLETNLITSLDLEDLGRGNRVLVAGEVLIVGGDGAVGDALELGGHVAVVVLANVLVGGALLGSSDGQLVEGVMGADGGGQPQDSGNVGGLHDE
ncbi:hypothetical protein HG530_006945 [Fusarium avenaceum]|nr:hypothetical protein HG530_006945 [Fusarium avenaceum]